MTTLVSRTTGAGRSSRQLRQTIRVVPIVVGSVQDFAQLDTIEAQQPRELSLAQQLAAVQPELARAAVTLVRQWQYAPGLLNDVAVDLPITVTVNFVGES